MNLEKLFKIVLVSFISLTNFTIYTDRVYANNLKSTADIEIIVDDKIQNGTISTDKNIVSAGDEVNLIIKPIRGYKLKQGSLKFKQIGGIDDWTIINNNKFTVPNLDTTINKKVTNASVYLYKNQEYTLTAQGGGGQGGHGVSAKVKYPADTILTTKVINNSAWIYDKAPDTTFKSTKDRQAALLVGAAGSGNDKGNSGGQYGATQSANGGGNATGSTGWYDGGGIHEVDCVKHDTECDENSCWDGSTCIKWESTNISGAGSSYIASRSTNISTNVNVGYNTGNAYINISTTLTNKQILITAEFEKMPEIYLNDVTTDLNGKLSFDKEYYYQDEIATIKIEANAGYKLKENSLEYRSILDNGYLAWQKLPNDYVNNFVVTKNNVEFRVEFEIMNFAIAKAETGGDISWENMTDNSGAYKFEDRIKVNYISAEGTKLKKLYYSPQDNKELKSELEIVMNGDVAEYFLNMPSYNILIFDEFEYIDYLVSADTNIEHGNVLSNNATSHFNEMISLEVSNIEEGYELDYFRYKKISDVNWNDLSQGTNEFIMPSTDVIISAIFKKSIYTIGKDATVINGNILFNINEATINEEVTVSFKSKRGYRYKQGTLKYYNMSKDKWLPIIGDSFEMPSSNIYVFAEFEVDPDYVQSKYANVDIETEHGWVDYAIKNENGTTTIDLIDYPFIGYELKGYTWRNKEDQSFKSLNGNTLAITSQDNILKYTTNNVFNLLAEKDYTILAQGGGGKGGHGVTADVNYLTDTKLTLKFVNNSAWVYDTDPDAVFKSIKDRQAALLVGAAGSGDTKGNSGGKYDGSSSANGQGSLKGSTGWYDGGGYITEYSRYIPDTCISYEQKCTTSTYFSPSGSNSEGNSCHYDGECFQKDTSIIPPAYDCLEYCSLYSDTTCVNIPISYDCSYYEDYTVNTYGAGSSYINTGNTAIQDYDESAGYSNNSYIEITRYFNDIEVKAEFKLKENNISISTVNGLITSDLSKAKYGDKVTLDIKPDPGFEAFEDMMYYKKAGTNEKYYFVGNTFTMPAFDIEIDYEFDELIYDIDNTTNIENATINKVVTHHTSFDKIQLEILPDPGYHYLPNTLKWKLKTDTDDNWNDIVDDDFSFINNIVKDHKTNYFLKSNDVQEIDLKADTEYLLSVYGGGRTVASGDKVSIKVKFEEETTISLKDNEIRLGKVITSFEDLPLLILGAYGYDLNNKGDYPTSEGMYGATQKSDGLNFSETIQGAKGFKNGGCSLTPVNGAIVCGGGSSFIDGLYDSLTDTVNSVSDNKNIIEVEYENTFNAEKESFITVTKYSNIGIEIKAEFETTNYGIKYVGDTTKGGLNFTQDTELHINDDVKMKMWQLENQEYSIVLGSIEYRLKTYPETIYGKDENQAPTYGTWINLGPYNWDYVMTNSDVEFRAEFITETKVEIKNQDVRQAVIEKYLDYRLNEKTNKYFDVYANEDNKYFLYTSEMTYLRTCEDLDLSYTGLKSTDGIDELIIALGSKTVNLSHNDIKSAIVTVPTVEKLFLEHNKLESLDISKLNNLVKLDVSNNNLDNIDITKNQNLTSFSATNNNFNTFDLSTNQNITDLNLSNNQIYAIDLNSNPNLVNVDLSNQNLYYIFPYNTIEFKLDITSLFPKETEILNLPSKADKPGKAKSVAEEIAKVPFDYDMLKEIYLLETSDDDDSKKQLALSNDEIIEKDDKIEVNELSVKFKSKEDLDNIAYEYYSDNNKNDLLNVIINISVASKPSDNNSSKHDAYLSVGQGVRVSLVNSKGNVQYVEDYSNDNYQGISYFGNNSKININEQSKFEMINGYKNVVTPNIMPKVFGDYYYAMYRYDIGRWFSTDDSLAYISKRSKIKYDDLLSGKYEMILEPVNYIELDGYLLAFTPTEMASYDSRYNGYFSLGENYDTLYKGFASNYFAPGNYDLLDANSITELTNKNILTTTLGMMTINIKDSNTASSDVTLDVDQDYTYTKDIDVYTSFMLSSSIERNASNPLQVKFISENVDCTQSVEVPENKKQLVYCKWHTPKISQTEEIKIYVDGIYATTLSINLLGLTENSPFDTKADDKKPINWILPNANTPNSAVSTSWNEYYSKWIPNWYYFENWQMIDGKSTDKGYWVGKWSFYPKGTEKSLALDEMGDTENPFVKTFNVTLKTTSNLYPDDSLALKEKDTMASGYGVKLDVKNIITGNGEYTEVQSGMSYFPEFKYMTYNRLLDKNLSSMTFKKNKYDMKNDRTHFTPVWYPDGKYSIKVKSYNLWTPNGMLQTTTYDHVNIKGALFNDWAIVKGE